MTKRITKSVQRHGYVRAWGGAVLVALWALLSGGGPVEAQAPRYRVAVLTPGPPFNLALEGLREGLMQLGYHEGKDLTFLVEDAQGEVASLASRAAKIVEAKPEVIFTIGTASTAAAKQATTTLPIVFAFVGDPLRSGLVNSYASSQNNLTGISNYSGPLSGKRLELLQEIVPGIKRVLVLVAPQDSVAEVSFHALVEVAPKLGIELRRHDVTSKEEIEQILKGPYPKAPWMLSAISRRAWWEPISISSLTRPKRIGFRWLSTSTPWWSGAPWSRTELTFGCLEYRPPNWWPRS